MNGNLGLVIDLIIAAIIAIVAFISAKQGFVRTVVGFVGFVAAVVIAFTVSEPLANATYDKYIEPTIIEAVEDKSADTADATAEQIWQSLPKLLTDNAEKLNITKDSLNGVIKQSSNVGEIVENISATVVKPVVAQIIKTLYAVIILTVLLFVVKLLAKLLNKVFSFSIVGKLNTLLGGAVGFVKGFFIALIVCEVLLLIISFVPNGIWVFNSQSLASSALFNLLTNIF